MEQTRKPSLVKNSIVNVIRYVLKILLPMITFPYVTRVLLPENYGKVNFCFSIIGYFILLAGLGINEYAIREGAAHRENRKDMGKFSSQIFTIGLISTLISYLLLAGFLFLGAIEKDYKIILAIQSLSLILTTLGVEWIYTIYEDFTYITIRSFIVQIISIICIFLFVKNENDYYIYAAITVGSTGLGYLINFIHARKYVDLRTTAKPDLKKHLKPILILFCNAALISVYIYSDKVILGIFLGDESVGIYEVSVKIYMMIKGALNAMVLVTMPRLSAYLRENKNEEYLSLAGKTLNSQIIVACPAAFGLFMISGNVVRIFAGDEYLKATDSLRILSIALLFAVLANIYVYVLMITQRMDKQILYATIFSSLLNIVLNIILIPLWGINVAAYTTLLSELSVAIIGVWCCRKKVPVRLSVKAVAGTVIGCACIVAVCLALSQFGLSLILDTALKVIISAVLYVLVICVAYKGKPALF